VTRLRVTACPAGHDLDVHGRLNADGSRNCTACERRAAREFRARRRMARPRPWVLVSWTADRDALASFAYFPTEADAVAHTPHDGRAWTVVNGTRPPWITLPSIEDLVRRSRSLDAQRRWPL
jgi:hypothetical protein